MTVVSLRVAVFYPELRSVSSFHLRVLEKLKQRIDEGAVCFIAAVSDLSYQLLFDKVVGTVEVSPSDFKNTSMEHIGHERKLYAMDLAVREEARRMGIASNLLEAVETYARDNYYREVYLHVEVDNEAARNLYRRNGYVEVPPHPWAVKFTERRLHKTPDSYVLLWKEIVF